MTGVSVLFLTHLNFTELFVSDYPGSVMHVSLTNWHQK